MPSVPRPKAIVLSPFATVPLDTGHRKRVCQTTRLLKDLGYQITFLLYAFEEGWKSAANEDWIVQMRRQWDELIVWRANAKVGMPPATGAVHDLDEWWDPSFEPLLQQLLGYRYFNVFAVHNVWMSKAFESAPPCTVKILDARGVFSSCRPDFAHAGNPPDLFITDERRQSAAASRADIVLAIQPNDQAWFAQHSSATSLCVPYYPTDAEMTGRRDYLHEDKVVFGFLGSGHLLNVGGLRSYCEKLRLAVGRTAAPVELRIGGAASESIRARGPWITCGTVADEKEFFAGIDIVVVPVFDGSGFQVKLADAVAMGLPVLCAEQAAIGTPLSSRVLARDPDDLARMTVEVALRRPSYAELQGFSLEASADLRARATSAATTLKATIGALRRAVAYDLTGLNEKQASAVLLSWSGAFHLMRGRATQYVVAPEALLSRFSDLVPAGVFFMGEQDIASRAGEVWRWITLDREKVLGWGANGDDIIVDRGWKSALDDCPETTQTDVKTEWGHFWQHIGWDPLVKRVLKDARAAASDRGKRLAAAQAIYVATAGRRARLEPALTGLFTDVAVTDIESFDNFAELLARVAVGNLGRLVVTDARHPVRVAMLAELCGLRGIAYVGPIGANGLSRGHLADEIVREGKQQFEQQWRMQQEPAARPAPSKTWRPPEHGVSV